MKAKIMMAVVAVVGLAFLISFTVSAKPPVAQNVKIPQLALDKCAAMTDPCEQRGCYAEKQKIEGAIAERFDFALSECVEEFPVPPVKEPLVGKMIVADQCKYLQQYRKAANDAAFNAEISFMNAAKECTVDGLKDTQKP